MPRIVVSGALASKPDNGGEAWIRLSYVLGLRRLGCEVHFLEQLEAPTPAAIAYFDDVVAWWGLSGATLIADQGEVARGLRADELVALADDTDLLLNLSGNLSWEPFFSRFRRRAYVDLDPGYTQVWSAQGHSVGRMVEHDVHFSVGLNVGGPTWSLPNAGVAWRPALPPVVLEEWPQVEPPERGRVTTVASWRGGYGRLEHEGTLYGQKAHELRKLAALPRGRPGAYELALRIDPADDLDRRLLEDGGWHLVDPVQAAGTPELLRRYIQGSRAELSVAQGLYVDTACGWFSDRTSRYLSTGRPAVVQDTGLAGAFPVGEGLLTFRTPQDAGAALERIEADYRGHCEAARALAEAHLDSDRVLARMLAEAGVGG